MRQRAGMGRSPRERVHSFVSALGLLAGLVALGAPGSIAATQDGVLQKVGGGLRFRELNIRAGITEIVSSENQRWTRWVLSDNVALLAEKLTLRADSVVLWLDAKAAARRPRKNKKRKSDMRPSFFRRTGSAEVVNYEAIQGFYAEGDVHLQHAGQVVRAERLYFDTAANKAIIVHGFVSAVLTRPDRPNVPFFARAEELKVLWDQSFAGTGKPVASIKEIHAKNANVTTCDFGTPHYHVNARDIEVTSLENDDNRFLGLTDTTLNIHDMPVFYLPYLAGDTSIIEYFPLKSVSVGSSSRFGTEIESTWGDDIKLRDRDGVRRKWGDWRLELDNRTRRGPGVGLTMNYDDEDYYGRITGYYQRDQADDIARNRNFMPPDNDRGRFWLVHRHRLPWDVELDVEANWIRDRNFLFEYFENEARALKPPESYVRLKKDHENFSARLLYRPRINEFFTRTEFLPGLRADLFSQPLIPGGFLGTNLYVDVEGQASQTRLRPDKGLDIRDFSANRGHFSATAEVPIRLGPIHVNPFITGEYTSWSELLTDQSKDDRHAWTLGARAFTQFWKTYEKGFFGLDVRHLVMPEVRFTNTYDVSLQSGIIPFEPQVDTRSEFEAITVRLQQKLQLKPGKDVVDIFELTFENVFFPDEDRDNPIRGRSGGRAEGPLLVDLKLGVAPVFAVLADTLIDWEEDDATVLNTTVLAGLGKIPGIERSSMRGYVGYRFAKRFGSVFSVGGHAQLGPKWTVGGFYQYDHKNDQSLDQRYFIGRTFHRFRFEVEFFVDGGNRDRGVRFAFAPVEFFNELRRFRRQTQAGQFRGDF